LDLGEAGATLLKEYRHEGEEEDENASGKDRALVIFRNSRNRIAHDAKLSRTHSDKPYEDIVLQH